MKAASKSPASTKKELIYRQILGLLENDRDIALRAALSARDDATNEENVAENKYDTLATEAAYLAEGQARRLREIEAALKAFNALELKSFQDDSLITIGALVLLESTEGAQRWLFLGPDAAGLKLRLEECELLVITPHSPIGQSLLGKRKGDEITILISGNQQAFDILGVE